MRVLTRTFPPSTNPNYGGILQAWALQQVLTDLGHDSWVDSTKSSYRSALAERTRQRVLTVISTLSRVGIRIPGQGAAMHREVNRRLLDFPDSHIQQVRLYRRPGQVDERVVRNFDAFISGSDQVWRPKYMNVPSYLFDFLSPEDSRPRIAYAASFGTREAEEYDEQLREITAPLARRFSAISVREESGRTIADHLWGVDASRTIDPTMLLDADRYRRFFLDVADDRGGDLVPRPTVSYVLDPTESKRRLVRAVSELCAGPPNDLTRPHPSTFRDLSSAPERFVRPSVQEWVRAMESASAVITDSYHGAVFAILFNRPFLLVPNAERGLARFDTLLALFGLTDRVAEDPADAHRVLQPVDWSRVNHIIKIERERGMRFLRESLAHRIPPRQCRER